MTAQYSQPAGLLQSGRFRAAGVALGFVAFALLICLRPDFPSFWLDESITAGHISAPQYVHYDAFHPPGYYWLLLHWSYLFGAGDIALRAFSVPWALLAVVLVWLLARRLLDPPADLLALWLFALSPLGLLYLRTARYFAMTLAVFLLVAYLMLLATSQGRWRHYILLGLAAAGLLWINYVAAILLLPGYLLLYSARRSQPAYQLRWAVAVVLPLAAFYPLAIKIIHSITALSAIPEAAHLQGTVYGFVIKLGLPVYAAIVGETTAPWHFYITVPVFVAGAILMLAGFTGALGERRATSWLKTWTWPAALVAVALVFSTVARSEPIVRVTSVALFALPFAYILIAKGAYVIRSPALAVVLVGLIFMGDVYGIHNYFTGRQFLNPGYNVPWQQVIGTIRSQWQPGDRVIECYEASFRRYWNDDTTMHEYCVPVPLARMEAVQEFPDSGQRIWLVARDRGAELPRRMTRQIRDELSAKARQVQVFDFAKLSPTEQRWRSRLLRRPVWAAYVQVYLFVP